MTLLVADRLGKVLGPTLTVADVSLHLDPGEILALVGPANSGKSAILDMIGGQLHPDRGRIRLGADEIGGADPRARFRLGIGRTFQRSAVFTSMTVRENLQTVILSARDQLGGWWRPARRYHRSRADLLLQRIDLLDHAERAATTLTLAQRHRLDLGVALAHRPRLLLLDEPTAGLLPAEILSLQALIRDIATRDGTAILWAEPDIGAVSGIADRILTMGDDGGGDRLSLPA